MCVSALLSWLCVGAMDFQPPSICVCGCCRFQCPCQWWPHQQRPRSSCSRHLSSRFPVPSSSKPCCSSRKHSCYTRYSVCHHHRCPAAGRWSLSSPIFFFLQQQIQEVFKNQQEQLSMQLLQQKNAGIVSQEVSEAHSGILFTSWWILHRCICYSMRTRSLVQVSFRVNKRAPPRFPWFKYSFKYCRLPDFNLSMSLSHAAMPEVLQTLNK